VNEPGVSVKPKLSTRGDSFVMNISPKTQINNGRNYQGRNYQNEGFKNIFK
jgi:hypothetical protein